MTNNLSQEFSRTESRILGTLSRLDAFLLNPSIQSHSRTTPETSRFTLGTNEGMNEDDSPCDPEASVSQSQNTRISGSDDKWDSSIVKTTFYVSKRNLLG